MFTHSTSWARCEGKLLASGGLLFRASAVELISCMLKHSRVLRMCHFARRIRLNRQTEHGHSYKLVCVCTRTHTRMCFGSYDNVRTRIAAVTAVVRSLFPHTLNFVLKMCVLSGRARVLVQTCLYLNSYALHTRELLHARQRSSPGCRVLLA